METYADCVKKAKELGISAEEIAYAFGIITENYSLLKKRLETATTQEERWGVYKDAPYGSEIEKLAIQAILDNTTTQKERWGLYNDSLNESKIEEAVLQVILDNATTQEERLEVYKEAPGRSEVAKAAIHILCS